MELSSSSSAHLDHLVCIISTVPALRHDGLVQRACLYVQSAFSHTYMMTRVQKLLSALTVYRSMVFNSWLMKKRRFYMHKHCYT